MLMKINHNLQPMNFPFSKGEFIVATLYGTRNSAVIVAVRWMDGFITITDKKS